MALNCAAIEECLMFKFDDVELIQVQQPTRDCTDCYFESCDFCGKDKPDCGLHERNEWIIFKEVGN